MPLSDQERRVLQELERELFIQDPALAKQLETGIPSEPAPAPKALNVIAAALGLALILLGIPIHPSPLGLLGFTLMVTAIVSQWMEHRRWAERQRSEQRRARSRRPA